MELSQVIAKDFAAYYEMVREQTHRWVDPLTEVLDEFFDPVGDEEVRDVRFLRSIVDQLRTPPEKDDAVVKVDYSVVRHYLEEQVGRMEQQGNFFSRGVTFCALKPARGIPASLGSEPG